MIGQVIIWRNDTRFGEILGQDGRHYFFAETDCVSEMQLRKGKFVCFEIVPGKKSTARNVETFNPSSAEPPSKKSDLSNIYPRRRNEIPDTGLLEEVSNWKLDANDEDLTRYFLNTQEVAQIENGHRSLVIGRKGTGKTAIANHLVGLTSHDTFAELMSFKNFPFNELYKFTDSKYTTPNQYITAWKFIIYSSILRMMERNEMIDSKLRETIRSHFKTDLPDSLPSRIKRAIGSSLKLGGWGFSLEAGKSYDWFDNADSLLERVEAVEKKVLEHVDDARYFIIFDALDDDYRGPVRDGIDNRYWDLLISLVKAVQDVRRMMRAHKKKLFPVVFVRDDIYSQIRDADKTKWMDNAIALVWHKEKLEDLFAFRISRSASLDGPIYRFKRAWSLISDAKSVNDKSIIDFIWNQTHSRPRDFIKYLAICARYSLSARLVKISFAQLLQARNAFSRYLALDIQAEAEQILPDIRSIYQVISDINKNTFRPEEFFSMYESHLKKGHVTMPNSEKVLSLLYDFNVLGNASSFSSGRAFFKYIRPDSSLSITRPIRVHPGLNLFLRLV